MKNTVLKFYITLVCLLSNLLLLADPGDDSDTGNLESGDPLPINATLYVLLIAGMLLAVCTFRKNRKLA